MHGRVASASRLALGLAVGAAAALASVRSLVMLALGLGGLVLLGASAGLRGRVALVVGGALGYLALMAVVGMPAFLAYRALARHGGPSWWPPFLVAGAVTLGTGYYLGDRARRRAHSPA